MRKRLKNLKNKSGHTENGAPRALIDLATYRSRGENFDSEYSGWSWASRPRDQAITIRQPFSPSTPQIG